MRKFPVRFHEKHGAFYYVFENKWNPLGRDYAEALKQYADLISPKTGKLPAIIDRWLENKEVAESTRKNYKMVAKRLKKAFEAFNPEDVKPSHFYQLIAAKGISDPMAGLYRSVMIGAMQLAVEEGAIDQNPIKEVKQYGSKKRGRYITDVEFKAIHDSASPTMRAIMTVLYLTGQRISDVKTIRYSQMTDEGIVFEQMKTKNRLCVAWSPELREAVAAAKSLHSSVKGLTLFHTRQGTVFSHSTIRTLWDRAVSKAGVVDAHIHDIRAKTATDAKKQGLDAKALLGHMSESSALRYQRSKETPIVEPVRMARS